MLYIDTDSLQSNVVPKLKSAKDYLDDVYDILSNLSIPSDFSGKSLCSSVKSKVNSLSDNLLDFKNDVIETCNNFEEAESKNVEVSSDLTYIISTIDNIKTMVTDFLDTAIENVESIYAELLSDSAWDDVNGVETETVEEVNNLAITQSSTTTAWDWITGAIETVGDWVSEVEDTLDWIAGAAETIVGEETWDYISNMGDIVLDQTCAVVADASNVTIGAVKGVSNLVEGVVDAVAVVGTTVATVGTGVWDIGSGIVTGDFNFSATSTMWKGVMSFVANDYVGMAFDAFYENTAVGQWLEESAHSPFKSEGIVTGIAEGIGEVAGIVLLTIATAGVGTAVTGSTVAVSAGLTSMVAGTSAFGRTVESNWNEIRENAEEDWQTLAAWGSGVAEGIVVGAWEGLQYFVGSEAILGSTGILGQKITNKTLQSVTRVGIDTLFNTFDTPYRAIASMITSEEELTFEEAFNELGGWTSVLISAGVGLIGSVGGELFDYYSSSKTKTSNDMDTSGVTNISDDINTSDITNTNIVNDVVTWNDLNNTDKSKLIQDAIDGKYNTKVEINVSNLNDLTSEEILNIINNWDKISIKDCSIDELMAFANNLSTSSLRVNSLNYTETSDFIQKAINGSGKVEIIVDDLNDLTSEDFVKIFLNQDKIDIKGYTSYDLTNFMSNNLELIYNNVWKSNSSATQTKIANVSAIAKEKLSKYGITDEQIDSALSKIRVIKDDQWYNVCEVFGYSGDTCAGFNRCSTHDIYLPESSPTGDIFHEMNHTLGDVHSTASASRGINEAITEKLALTSLEDFTNGKSGYSFNVGAISKIIEIYNNNGYDGENIVFYSYLSQNSDMLKNSLNSITGDSSFYTKLSSFMDIADGFSSITDKASVLLAKKRVLELVKEFGQAIKSIK